MEHFYLFYLLFKTISLIASSLRLSLVDGMQILANFALVIIGALSIYIARLSFIHSKTSLEHSDFSNLFNTQITLLRHFFGDNRVKETVMYHSLLQKLGIDYTITKDYSVYKAFCLYFQKQTAHVTKSQFLPRQICCIWNDFCYQLVFQSEFTYSFKYIYLCVHTVDQSPLSNTEKEQYIRIISYLLTSEQLFCYFMSLVAFCSGDCSTDPTVQLLKKHKFFKSMMKGHYFREMAPFIPTDITKCFS